MLDFHVAYRTQAGRSPRHDSIVDGRLSDAPSALRLVTLVQQPDSFENVGILLPLPKPPGSIEEQLSAAGFNVYLRVILDPARFTLEPAAAVGVLQYFRLADATLLPLPPEDAGARHRLLPGKPFGHPLRLSAGDAYLAVSPAAARLADSPAIARFLHLRDYFNAEKLAEALLEHLLTSAHVTLPEEDVTVLVVEAR